MTDTDDLERRERAIEDELNRRERMTTTERQVAAAQRGRRRDAEGETHDDRSAWSTTELQAFAATGRKPARGGRVKPRRGD